MRSKKGKDEGQCKDEDLAWVDAWRTTRRARGKWTRWAPLPENDGRWASSPEERWEMDSPPEVRESTGSPSEERGVQRPHTTEELRRERLLRWAREDNGSLCLSGRG